MDIEIDKWYLEDLIFGKTVYVKVQNGIDKGVIYDEIQLPNYKDELVYLLITTIIILTLARSISTDFRKGSKPS